MGNTPGCRHPQDRMSRTLSRSLKSKTDTQDNRVIVSHPFLEVNKVTPGFYIPQVKSREGHSYLPPSLSLGVYKKHEDILQISAL